MAAVTKEIGIQDRRWGSVGLEKAKYSKFITHGRERGPGVILGTDTNQMMCMGVDASQAIQRAF